MTGRLASRLQGSARYRWIVLVTVASGMMMAILSSSIVNIALPEISKEFGSGIPTTAWVATIYMITQATFMPVSGRAGDIYGHRSIYVAGLLVFTAMSVLCTFAWSVHSLIIGRGLMAIGTSALSPMALAFVMDAFPGRERAQALGVMGGIMGTAPTVGLVGGGFLVEGFGWRSVFLVAVPLCVVIVPLALLVLRKPEKRAADRGFDIIGGILLTAGLFSGLLSLSQGKAWGWRDPRTVAGFAAFAILLVSFVLWEMRARRPMLDLGLFRFRSLVSANIASFFTSATMFGTLVLLPFFFQTLLGDSPVSTGLKMAPLALMYLVVAPLGGRLTNVIGARSTPRIGLVVAGGGYLLLSQVISVDVSTMTMAFAVAVMGVGLGLTTAPLTTSALHDVPSDKRGIAASLPQMSRFIGGSFGMAVVGTFLSWRLTSHLTRLGVPADVASGGSALSPGTAGIEVSVFNQAFAAAFQDVFLFTLVFVAIAIVAVAFVPQLKGKGEALENSVSDPPAHAGK